MKIFISYSMPADQLVALRLQTLAAVYGLTVHVPPATTRQTAIPDLSEEVQQSLRDCDVVLAVMTRNPAASVIAEMNQALAMGKLMIPIVSPSVSPEYYVPYPPYFLLNPSDPSQTEAAIVKFLAEKQQSKNTTHALVALATLALGLILFSSESK